MFQPKRLAIRYLTALVVCALLSATVTSCLPNPFNQKPTAMIATPAGVPYGPAPLTVIFDISGSTDPDGEIVSFTLDFADGSEAVRGTDLMALITHTYLDGGMYLVTLTVMDDEGVEGRVQLIVNVSE